jgi:hypothetical protein
VSETIRARDFVQAVYDGVDGYLNVRTLPPIEQTFVPIPDVDALEAFVTPRRDRNAYIGVAARVNAADGSLKGCGALPALFVDLDFKDFPDEAATRHQLAAAPFPPSITVQSGGGLQSWWLLREPINLQHDAPAAKSLLRRLAVSLHADLASAEPAHILRLPNTLNFKYQPPRRVKIEVFEPARRYNTCDFDDYLPDEPPDVRVLPGPIPDAIPQGSRNAKLTSLAGMMRKRGFVEASIAAALLAENAAKCRPPLPDADVRRIAKSVGRYEPSDTVNDAPREISRLMFMAADEIISAPRPAEIIEGFAWEGWLSVLVSESGVGKTFVLLDAAASVSSGVAWHRREVLQGSVAYISFEGDALGLRLRAIREKTGHRLEHVYILRAHDPLSPRVTRDGEERSIGELTVVGALETLAAELLAGALPPIRLVILDTIRASLVGSEDNSEDVAAYFRTVRRVLACVPNAAAVLAHHAGWQDGENQKKRERGSSAFRGNCDTTAYLEACAYDKTKGEAELTLTTLKVRDAEKPAPLHFVRKRVEVLEMDRRGDPVTSCIIEPDRRSREDRETEAAAVLNQQHQKNDLQTLKAIAKDPSGATSQDRLRLLLGVQRGAVYESVSRLLRREWIQLPSKQRQPYTLTDAGKKALDADELALIRSGKV